MPEFEQAVVRMLELKLRDPEEASERSKHLTTWSWWDADSDQSGSITFPEFLKWYQSNGFHEELLLNENEREMRSLAKQFEITPNEVEHIKLCFDTYDTDGSGEVDINEFR